MPTGIYDRKMAKPNPGMFNVGHEGYTNCKGIKLSKEHIQKLSKPKLNGLLREWNGRHSTYTALHHWVGRNFGKSSICEMCNGEFKGFKQMHWANKSGKYTKNREDWMRLCRWCHEKYDHKRAMDKIERAMVAV